MVGAFVEACKQHDIRPCLYYNWLDFYHLYGPKSQFEDRVPPNQLPDSYWEHALSQIKELLTWYGNLEMIWFDRGPLPGRERVRQAYDLCHRLQPEVIVLNNQGFVDGSEVIPSCWPLDIVNGEDTPPPEPRHNPWKVIDGQNYYVPMEVCYRSSKRWLDAVDNDPRPVAELVDIWHRSVERGTNLLLNLTPDRRGQIACKFVEPIKSMLKIVLTSG